MNKIDNITNRSCAVCGRALKGNQKVTCNNDNCERKYQRKYLQEYRFKHKRDVARWQKTSQERKKERRKPKYCSKCGAELNNYHRKICDKCKKIRALEIQRNYYNKNKEKEAKRKANWFRKNKIISQENNKEKELLLTVASDKECFVKKKESKKLVKKILEPQIFSLGMDVKKMDISNRAKNCLKRNKINTVKEVLKYSERNLLIMDGMGYQSLKKIKKAIGEHGLVLKYR